METFTSPKQAILNTVLDRLYVPPTQELDKVKVSLIERNSRKYGNHHNGFSFRGKIHVMPGPHKTARINLLHKELRQEMKEYVARVTALSKERTGVAGILAHMVIKFHTVEDYIAILPETLEPLLAKHAVHFPEAAAASRDEIQAFRETNEQYLSLITTRMTYNLLGAANV